MIEFKKEYFLKPYYFFLTEKSDRISLYYSIADTLTESRRIDEKMDFDKKHSDKVRKSVSSILKLKKLKTKDQIKKYFEPVAKDELDEFIDKDGTLTNSSIPILDMGLTPHKTLDQTVVMSRIPGNPLVRGYRRYYGESVNDEEVVNEVDYLETFGYKETKDMNGKQTYRYLVKNMGMNPDEAKQRTKQFGKDPYGEKTKRAPKEIRNKKGFIDRMTLSEIERRKMIKVVEDILVNKKNKSTEMSEKNSKVSKVIKKNIDALKKMADKDGLTTNELIKMFKSE